MADKKTKLELDNSKELNKLKKANLKLDQQILDFKEKGGKLSTTEGRELKKQVAEKRKLNDDSIKIEKARKKQLSETRKEAKGAADQAKAIGDKMENFVK